MQRALLEPAFKKAKKIQDTLVFVYPKDGMRMVLVFWASEADQAAWESNRANIFATNMLMKMEESYTGYQGTLIASVFDEE